MKVVRRGQANVRDITDDLRERLEATRAELSLLRTKYDQDRRELEAKFADQCGKASCRLNALETLLEEETGENPRPQIQSAKALRLPLQEFILNALEQQKMLSKDEIKDLVERAGYVEENGSAGRMVHTTLFNAVKAGRIANNGDHYSLSVAHRVSVERMMALSSFKFQEKGPSPIEGNDPL